jgi:multidrug resistance efflux pump
VAEHKTHRRPALWKHPRVLWSRILSSWPLLIWLIAVVVAALLYVGYGQVDSLEGIVDTTSEPVAPIETARLNALHVELGQTVAKGDTLATMDTSLIDAEYALQEAQFLQTLSSMGRFASRALDQVQAFEQEIQDAKYVLGNVRLQQNRDQAESTELQAQKINLEEITRKTGSAILRGELYAIQPRIAALNAQIASYPALIEIVQTRLADAQEGYEELITALGLEEGDDVREAIRKRDEFDRKILGAAQTNAWLRQEAYTLRAMNGGTVSRIFHQPGAVVSAGDPVLRVIVKHPEYVIGFLPERHLHSVTNGMPLFVSRRTQRLLTHAATVVSVAPEVDRLPIRTSPIQGQTMRGRRLIVRINGEHDFIPGESVRIEGVRESLRDHVRNLIARPK